MIGGAPDGDWYDVYMMCRARYLREENVEKRICRCASYRLGSVVEVVAHNSEAFCASLSALPIFDASM